MFTLLIGLAILIVGGFFYGRFCERVFGPDDRSTPAVTQADGVDFVPMKPWRNSLIQLLNIAGTGPVLGPIQGALFGPIALVLIPIGCVLGGALHDYFAGMISMRNKGAQMPESLRKYLGDKVAIVYRVVTFLLMFLVVVVFVYTPGDIIAGSIMHLPTAIIDENGAFLWSAFAPLMAIYLVILAYYLLATLLPIDKIIGKIYPIFGAVLLLSAIGVFVGLFASGGVFQIAEVWGQWPEWVNNGVIGMAFGTSWANIVPMFFITVACGIVSGFHATQSCIISRSMTSEKQGRLTFYTMMLLEGFIAIVWASATIVVFTNGLAEAGAASPLAIVGIVAESFLGKVGGTVVLLGVVVLAVSSGDTAMRSLRLMICDDLHITSQHKLKIVAVVVAVFVPIIWALIWAKLDPMGFNVLWRYFSFANTLCAISTFALVTAYLYLHRKPWAIALLPGCFYVFVASSYILNAPIGFGLSWSLAYPLAGALVALFAASLLRYLNKERNALSGEKASEGKETLEGGEKDANELREGGCCATEERVG